jgi:hypothetical protein
MHTRTRDATDRELVSDQLQDTAALLEKYRWVDAAVDGYFDDRNTLSRSSSKGPEARSSKLGLLFDKYKGAYTIYPLLPLHTLSLLIGILILILVLVSLHRPGWPRHNHRRHDHTLQ